jgi:SET domain-containing protein
MSHLKKFEIGLFEAKGRGLVAKVDLPAGELIELCSVLVIPSSERAKLAGTIVSHYYFHWEDGAGEEDWSAAIALGSISLCNHAPHPTARFELDRQRKTIALYALHNIAAGDEITIDYDCALWW